MKPLGPLRGLLSFLMIDRYNHPPAAQNVYSIFLFPGGKGTFLMLELCLPHSETLVKPSLSSHLTHQNKVVSFYINCILLFEHLSAFQPEHKEALYILLCHSSTSIPLFLSVLYSCLTPSGTLFPASFLLTKLNVQQLPAISGLAHS